MPINTKFKDISKKNFKNYFTIFGLIAVLLVVMVGATQVILKNLNGDQASAFISNNYLAQIGITSVDNISNGAFSDSKKICQSIDGACQFDGLIDYNFTSITSRTGISEASGGGLILDKSSALFVQNGDFTSKNYVPNAGYGITLTKIQVGVGLKPETLVSLGYSVDNGANYQTAIGNFSNDQLKSQSNQNIIEYILPSATRINQGFSYKIALKADSKKEASPSLKFVRIFYNVTAPNSSSTGGTTTSGTTTGGTTSTSSGTTSGTLPGGTISTSSGATPTTTSGTSTTPTNSNGSFLPIPSGGGDTNNKP